MPDTDKTTLKNTTVSPFSFPDGTVVPANDGMAQVENFEQYSEHTLVKSWVNSGKLVVVEGEGLTISQAGDDDKAKLSQVRADELRAMTVAELSTLIDKKGGKDKLKAGMSKDEVVALALEIGA